MCFEGKANGVHNELVETMTKEEKSKIALEHD